MLLVAMGVVVMIGRRRALLRGGEWRSPDVALERALNVEMELSSTDPEKDAAVEMARRFSGKVSAHAPARRRASAQIYFAKRQYRFAFS
jgi:hypothetical protein